MRPNALWLADITKHWTGEGTLYLCSIKDCFSNKIVAYSVDSRMKSRLVVHAQQRRRAVVPKVVGRWMRGSQRPQIAISINNDAAGGDPPRQGRLGGPSRL
jgi:transposase InsO family protein